MPRKVIISCAVTGAIHTPTMSEFLPISPESIARQAIDAAKEGAAIIHLHARNPVTGQPDQSPEAFKQILPIIHENCDAKPCSTGDNITAVFDGVFSGHW